LRILHRKRPQKLENRELKIAAAVLKKIKTNEIFSSRAEKYTGFAREACKSSALLSSPSPHFSNKTNKNTLYQNICSTLFIINSGVILPRPTVLLFSTPS